MWVRTSRALLTPAHNTAGTNTTIKWCSSRPHIYPRLYLCRSLRVQYYNYKTYTSLHPYEQVTTLFYLILKTFSVIITKKHFKFNQLYVLQKRLKFNLLKYFITLELR